MVTAVSTKAMRARRGSGIAAVVVGLIVAAWPATTVQPAAAGPGVSVGPVSAVALLADEYPPCTITGTDGDDVIDGTAEADVICGQGGKDTIHGNSGDDVILGEGSDDLLYGDNGNDTLDGGRGFDAIYGGNNDDTLTGNVGGDRLEGRGGDDTFDMADGVEGNDAAGGGKGADTCTKDPDDYCGKNAEWSSGGTISVIDDALQARMPYSWHPGCPVGFDDLRYLELNFLNFKKRVTRGELVVHESEAQNVLDAMRGVWEARFPISKMVLVDEYQADDDASMADDNTSAFNCRYLSGTHTWSQHAYGKAVDINPVQNPYIKEDGTVKPPAGNDYLDRTNVRTGMIIAGDDVVAAFEAVGWEWGGFWQSSTDYQHFSWNGE